MRVTTIIIVVAALAVSVLTAFMIQWYLGSRSPSTESVREKIPAERVLVAKIDITGGTVMKSKEHFSWQAWPQSGLRKEFILKGSNLDKEFEGAILRHDIKSGVPLTAQSVYRGGEKGFVASGLKPGMRAVGVKIDPVIGVGGFVRPGDRVDIILTTTLNVTDKKIKKDLRNADTSRKVSETILQNIRVIAINQNAESSGKNEKKPKLATLEVTSKQAEILANARRMGKLFLVLRSHVTAAEKPAARKYQFTSDLEIMSAMRGGLVAHIDEVNRQALREFKLDRWITGAEAAKAKPLPRPAASVTPKPKEVRRTLPQPKNLAGPTPKKAIKTAPSAMELKLQELEKKLGDQDKKIQDGKKSAAPVKPVPAKVVAPVKRPTESSTVRVDRAGAVKVLKFKGDQ